MPFDSLPEPPQPAAVTQLLDDLTAVESLLARPARWCRLASVRPAVDYAFGFIPFPTIAYCLTGAMRMVTTKSVNKVNNRTDAMSTAFYRANSHLAPMCFNDLRGRTHKEVLLALARTKAFVRDGGA